MPDSKRSNSHFESVLRMIFLSDSKRSQSQVIASILLILLAISMVVIVIGFVIPFVRDQLSESDCVKVINKVNIQNDVRYTCYSVLNGGEMNVQVHVGENESLVGFSIELGGAATNSFEIKNGVVDNNLKMFGGNYNSTLQIPGKNEERTYVIKFSNVPDSVSIYPILIGGRICPSSDELNRVISC